KNLLSRGQEIQVDVAEEDKVCAALAPGQISLHHGLTVHGSGPNITDDRRIGAVIRYLSPHVQKPGGHIDYGFAARGNCDTGNYTLTPAPQGWFEPADMELYEQIREDQAKVMMAGATGNADMYS
ncbi:MAG: phytanoyl-CoA dioxygenase family protein, partial [Planktomarina sp.]